jgi:hypothetical protein
LSFTAFEELVAAGHRDHAEFGPPQRVLAGMGMSSPEVLRSASAPHDFGFFPDIPAATREAWMHATFGVALDEETGDIERCYDAWFLVTEERGRLRVGHLSWEWCD